MAVAVAHAAAAGEHPGALRHAAPVSLRVAVGLPLLLQSVALGLGTDVAAWCAPWALAAALPYVAGTRAGRVASLIVACVAIVAGAAPLAGAAAGAAGAELALRGAPASRAVGLALLALPATTALLALAW